MKSAFAITLFFLFSTGAFAQVKKIKQTQNKNVTTSEVKNTPQKSVLMQLAPMMDNP